MCGVVFFCLFDFGSVCSRDEVADSKHSNKPRFFVRDETKSKGSDKRVWFISPSVLLPRSRFDLWRKTHRELTVRRDGSVVPIHHPWVTRRPGISSFTADEIPPQRILANYNTAGHPVSYNDSACEKRGQGRRLWSSYQDVPCVRYGEGDRDKHLPSLAAELSLWKCEQETPRYEF